MSVVRTRAGSTPLSQIFAMVGSSLGRAPPAEFVHGVQTSFDTVIQAPRQEFRVACVCITDHAPPATSGLNTVTHVSTHVADHSLPATNEPMTQRRRVYDARTRWMPH
eukprot:278833-Prymnesium_polylepis.1